MKSEGLLLVISGPSGTGKGTICQQLRARLSQLAYSISVTTREPRSGEVDGQDYFFKTEAQARQMIAEDLFLEHADVYGHIYGTPKPYVLNLLAQGKDVLLEIDIQGALQIKKAFPEGILVFILPPSLAELKERIVKRGKDSADTIKKRLSCAVRELGFADQYDYVIVNDQIEAATDKICHILEAERCRSHRMFPLVDNIIKNDVKSTAL